MLLHEEYLELRDIIMDGGDFEKHVQKHIGYDNMTEYLYNFDTVVWLVDQLQETALEYEDYEFCKELVNLRIWSHWKNTEIDLQLDYHENEEN